MTCSEHDTDLQAFWDRELEPSRRMRLEEHIAGCQSCQRRLQLFEELRSALRAHAAVQKAPVHVKEHTRMQLQRVERRRSRSWRAIAAMVAVALLSSLAGMYWFSTSQEDSALLAELVNAHAALARGEIPLAYPSPDAAMVQRWLGERLPFRPFVPREAAAEFRLLGAQTVSVFNQAGAVLLFTRDGHKVSLVSLPAAGKIPSFGKKVHTKGMLFWTFMQGGYTLVLWLEEGLLFAMVGADDVEELLEYAHLCVLQMRSPT